MGATWHEPTDEWKHVPAAQVQSFDYVLDSSQRRLKVLASYSASAGGSLWYIDAYAPGEPTRRIGCDPDQMMPVEVRDRIDP